ncbi:hypothetical protein PYCCODRAFT_1419900 [Trametes coccinea BRFM310]|uniref:Nucleolar protein 12 n=1 Tax=Trametes coccinea (strain BRFM310) TaxID=1353009 RepID=A0A1Y2I974_TRAC3|nr:hypothetical protein PYCCODRAFT_1419900 [Trametes coccinea BRFM310]
MSLSSLLLSEKAKAKEIDKGLDELFRSSTAVAPPRPPVLAQATTSASATHPAPSEKKRKATEETPSGKSKRSKSEATATPSSSKQPSKAAQKAKKQKKDESSSESEEDEDAKLAERMQNKGKGKATAEKDDDAESESSNSDDEVDPPKLVHESLQKGGPPKGQSRHGKAKFVPSEETPEQRDARTIFVGNVAVDVTKSRPTQKQFKRHILSFVPSAKIESVRFRSVGFKKPTAELPNDEDGKPKPKKARPHDRDRTAAWRAEQDEEEAAPKKQFLTPQEKKRIAFIKHEIHEGVDSVNAYVVFAHPPPAESRPANLPPLPPVMNPYEAAVEAARLCDGSVFLGRTLRVDVVKKDASPIENAKSIMTGDPKATVFVGNLDFASKEEDLRAFFETLLRKERGEPGEREEGESSGSEDEAEAEERERTGAAKVQRPRTWVKRVRIIRDRDTQLGKGFAYVQFVDRECVDEVLALEEGKLKFAKRKLRVQRCKTLPGGPKLKTVKPARGAASAKSNAAASKLGQGKPGQRPDQGWQKRTGVPLVPAKVPKGNPELGAKLASLPKEERKRVKAQDADRVARRLAKKRAKALAEKGVKSRVDRERVRKPRSEKKAGGREKGKEKPKKRVRSGKAIAKLNTKK